MMRTILTRILAILLLSTFLAGCKLVVIVTGGGDIQSLTTTRDCAGGSVCEFEITDTNFAETFTAVPREGYQFVGWRDGGSDFLCGGSINPSCQLSNLGLGGIPVVNALIASFEMYHIMPDFEFVGIDTDGDTIFDHLDPDDDNDGLLDELDPCPLDPDLSCTAGEVIEQLINTTCWTVSADVGNAAAQSFTPSVSGTLTGIEMAIQSDAFDTSLTIIQGDINGSVVRTQFAATPSITGSPAPLVSYTLSSPLPVTAGQLYTMAISDSGGFGMRFCGSGANPYPGGQAYQMTLFLPTSHPTDDAAFRVTIE